MYTSTSTSSDMTPELFACRTLVAVSVVICVLGFVSKGLLPAAILTVVLGATVVLTTYALGRAVRAYKAKDWRLFVQVVVLTIVFLLIEKALGHIGLTWLNETYSLTDARNVDYAQWFLPLVNLFASDSFTRNPPVTEEDGQDSEPAAPRLDDIFWGNPGDLAAHHARMDNWERKMANDPERIAMPKHRTPSTEEILSQVRQKMMGGH